MRRISARWLRNLSSVLRRKVQVLSGLLSKPRGLRDIQVLSGRCPECSSSGWSNSITDDLMSFVDLSVSLSRDRPKLFLYPLRSFSAALQIMSLEKKTLLNNSMRPIDDGMAWTLCSARNEYWMTSDQGPYSALFLALYWSTFILPLCMHGSLQAGQWSAAAGRPLCIMESLCCHFFLMRKTSGMTSHIV